MVFGRIYSLKSHLHQRRRGTTRLSLTCKPPFQNKKPNTTKNLPHSFFLWAITVDPTYCRLIVSLLE
jgi:hypothetical protein